MTSTHTCPTCGAVREIVAESTTVEPEDYYILRDNRTTKYFGGGKADQKFVFWVDDKEEAKKFYSQASLKKFIDESVKRNEFFLNRTSDDHALNSIPRFSAEHYSLEHAFIIDEETIEYRETISLAG